MITASTEKVENEKKTESAKLSAFDRSAQATHKAGSIAGPDNRNTWPEASPTETPAATPAEVAETKPATSASLNDGPISTNRQDGERRGRTVIKLKGGVSVEADAAWEDRLGIWYRQGGLVSYVERESIESIGEPAKVKQAACRYRKALTAEGVIYWNNGFLGAAAMNVLLVLFFVVLGAILISSERGVSGAMERIGGLVTYLFGQ